VDLRLFQYLVYLLLSVLLTIWAGQTLHRNGRRFLIDVLRDDSLADSVNHLLLVGFYLVNLGGAALLINTGDNPQTSADMVQTLATRLGLVMLMLGGMHFGNLIVLSVWRRRTQMAAYAEWYYRQRAEIPTPAAS